MRTICSAPRRFADSTAISPTAPSPITVTRLPRCSNALGRGLHAPMFASPTTAGGRPNFARYFFLDDGSREFFIGWDAGAAATVALLRAEAGREPHDKALRELIGELSTLSEDSAHSWAAHDIRTRHDGTKRLQHPEVGEIKLSYQSVDLPMGSRAWHDLSFYTAEPGSPSEERLQLLGSLSAASPDPAGDAAEPTAHRTGHTKD